MKDEGGGMKDEDLKVRTKRFALRVIKVYAALPKYGTAEVLGKQLLRAGTSVGAHYREAQRAKSTADFVSKIEGALQELDESQYWLELLVDSGTLPAEKLAPLVAECDELLAIFVTIAKSAKQQT
jgi:four helix bundle protein